jgi:hypothetical protein
MYWLTAASAVTCCLTAASAGTYCLIAASAVTYCLTAASVVMCCLTAASAGSWNAMAVYLVSFFPFQCFSFFSGCQKE